MKTSLLTLLLVSLAMAFGGCHHEEAAKGKRYPMQGEIKALDANQKSAIIDAGKIGDWMEAMTMDYPVKPDAEFQKLHVGDRIEATVVVLHPDPGYYVTDVKVAGRSRSSARCSLSSAVPQSSFADDRRTLLAAPCRGPLPVRGAALFRTEPGVQVLVLLARPAAKPRRNRDGPRTRRLRPTPSTSPASAPRHRRRVRRAPLQHADLRRHRASLPDALPRRPYQRPAGRPARPSRRRPPARLAGRLFAGRQRGAETRRGTGRTRRRQLIAGVCAVSTPLDLEACARRIAEPDNRLYECALRPAHAGASGGHRPLRAPRIRRAAFRDSTSTTASPRRPSASATPLNYYRTQSALNYLDGLRVPVLLIQAKDDTFIPYRIFGSRSGARQSPHRTGGYRLRRPSRISGPFAGALLGG